MTRKGCNQNNVTFLLKLILDLSRYQIFSLLQQPRVI